MILHVRTRTGGGGPDEAPGGCHVRAQRAGLERRITDEVGEGLGSRQSNRLFTFIGDGHGGGDPAGLLLRRAGRTARGRRFVRRWSAGPIPDSMSSCGEPMAPAQTM